MRNRIYRSLMGLFVGLIVLMGATVAFGESPLAAGELSGAGFVVEGNFDRESLMLLVQPVNCDLAPTLCPKPGCPPWAPQCPNPFPWPPCSPEDPNCPWDPPSCNPRDPDCPIPPIKWEKPEAAGWEVAGWKAFVLVCVEPEMPCRAVPLEELMESPEES